MENIFIFNRKKRIEDIEDEVEEKDISITSILNSIENKDVDFFKSFGEDKFEIEKKWTKKAFPVMKFFSAVGINKIDFDEAKRQGRKKGDGKGPWPSKVYDTKNTFYYLLVTNELINKNFWLFTKKIEKDYNHSYLLYLLMCLLSIKKLQKDEVHLWLGNQKNSSDKDFFIECLKKINPNLNKQEISILEQKYKNEKGLQKIKFLLNLDEKEFEKLKKEIL